MHSDIVESHHAFEIISQGGVNPTGYSQECEYVAGTLWHAESVAPDQVLPHVESSFAGPLDV